jgi:DNA-binding PadR family transcriptional regulator
MAFEADQLPEHISRLVPLTPAVFYVLLALSSGARHGYSIMQETTSLSEGGFAMGPATLYSTIQRLLDLDLIVETTGDGETDSRRRYYELSSTGLRLLEAEVKRMNTVMRRAARLVQRRSEG